MLEKVDFYYFSPTGGTKKVGEVFAGEVARTVCPWDLGKMETRKNEAELRWWLSRCSAAESPALPHRDCESWVVRENGLSRLWYMERGPMRMHC